MTGKEEFLNTLKTLQFVRLDNQDEQMGAVTYTLRLGNDELVVYANHILWKGELYSIYQGDFDFLADVEYSSSSEWLPWI